MSRFQAFLAAAAMLTLAACSTSHVLVGHPRAPISPDQVTIYTHPPQARFEEIARIDTSSQGSFSFSAQGKTDAVLMRLKKEAAKLGANGVLLEGIGDQPSGSIGTGGGTESYSGGGAVGGGVGIGIGLNKKVASGMAIYVGGE